MEIYGLYGQCPSCQKEGIEICPLLNDVHIYRERFTKVLNDYTRTLNDLEHNNAPNSQILAIKTKIFELKTGWSDFMVQKVRSSRSKKCPYSNEINTTYFE